MTLYTMEILCFVIIAFISPIAWAAFGFGNDKVLLSDVSVLTLRHGQMTTGRRSQPIPQMSCVGGTAGCKGFTPQVVQCYNRGSDGFDVQWECKSDMDNAYRFGTVQLQYTLDLTKEGHQQAGKGHQNYYNEHGSGSSSSQSYPAQKSSAIGDVVMLIIVGLIIYGIYKTCVSQHAHSPDSSDYPDGGDSRYPGRSGFGGGGNPPPYESRDSYTQGGASCGGTQSGGAGSAGGGGGFWSGLATGGALGYLFGNRGTGGYNAYHPGHRTGWGTGGSSWGSGRSGWGSGGSGWGGGGGFSGGGSTGTRTASGFGGTQRR
ncbi:PREDICTED: store-operated calcium entry-associated regulatory factor-like isoform X2 [Priapulus caudatus]|uniref:Store-operated calcium entry-associated regulatory factor n=1 Tax=Priapulus caudatus TaxID=37621 RepID=A0ABM1DZA2_PRICU|nr:PREDICTED: store-operated calcium entry-associated regulatory factor-like isoform X2 [Priapulus caudatus]